MQTNKLSLERGIPQGFALSIKNSYPSFKEVIPQRFRNKDICTINLFNNSLYVKKSLLDKTLGIDSPNHFLTRFDHKHKRMGVVSKFSFVYKPNMPFGVNYKLMLEKKLKNIDFYNPHKNLTRVALDYFLPDKHYSTFRSRIATINHLERLDSYSKFLHSRNLPKYKIKKSLYYFAKENNIKIKISPKKHKYMLRFHYKCMNRGILLNINPRNPKHNHIHRKGSYSDVRNIASNPNHKISTSNQVVPVRQNNNNKILNSGSAGMLLLNYKYYLVNRNLFRIINKKQG